MTLALGLVTPHGIWMGSDNRLFNTQTKQPEPDPSTKQFGFKTEDGIATVAYSGIGRLASGNHVSDFLVRLLRGESRSLDETLLAIRGFANEQIAPVAWDQGIPHTFVVGTFLGDTVWAAVITNLEVVRLGYPANETRLRRSFETAARHVPEGIVLATGQLDYISDEDRAKLDRAIGHRPRRPDNYSDLLAKVIRRAAWRAPHLISETCDVTQIVPPDRVFETKAYGWGQPIDQDSAPRFLLFGIDTNEMLRGLMSAAEGVGPNAEDWAVEAVRLERGVRVTDLETHRLGMIAADPVPTSRNDEVGVTWDAEPGAVVSVRRNTIKVLYPDHPADRT